mgnify:CR=1 FL=1
MRKIVGWTVLAAAAFAFTTSSVANAEIDGHRLSIGAGVVQLGDSSHTYFALSGEYEYRLDPMLGLGTFVNYVFSDPGVTLIGLPEVFFHPLSNGWYINAAPIAQFASGYSTHFGVRLGTRIPIELGALSIIPQVAVDFINGGRNLIFGLGISI